MKLNIQKRVLPLLCVLALIVACGSAFAVPAFAEDVERIYTDNELSLAVTSYDQNGSVKREEYFPGTWPTSCESYGRVGTFAEFAYPVFNVTGFSAPKGAFVLMGVPLPVSHTGDERFACTYRVKISLSAIRYCLITVVITNGELVVGNIEQNSWPGGVFGDDLAVFVDGNALQVSGTLISAINEVTMQAVWNDVTFSDDEAIFTSLKGWEQYDFIIGWIENVEVTAVSPFPVTSGPYYPGTTVQMQANVIGTGGYDSSVTWSVDSGLSGDVTIDENGLLYIPTYEQALSVEVTATSVQDPAISGTYTLDITYPLEGVSIVPGGTEYYPYSSKDRTIQYSLLLPNGDPYEYEFIEWTIEPTAGHEEYFSVDDVGMVTIKGGAPAGSGYTLRWCYAWDAEKVAPGTAALTIISNDEAIQDGGQAGENLATKGDELDNKNEQLGGVVGDLNNAVGVLPTTPGDVSAIVDIGLLDQSVSLMTTILDYEAMGLGDLMPVLGLLAGLAVIIYLVFGKRG